MSGSEVRGCTPHERVRASRLFNGVEVLEFSFDVLATCAGSELTDKDNKINELRRYLHRLCLPSTEGNPQKEWPIINLNRLTAVFHAGHTRTATTLRGNDSQEPLATTIIFESSAADKSFLEVHKNLNLNWRQETVMSPELLALRFMQHHLYQIVRHVSREWCNILATSFSQVTFLIRLRQHIPINVLT